MFPRFSSLQSLVCDKNLKETTFEDIEAYYEILKYIKVHLKVDGKPKANVYYKWIHVKPLYYRMKMKLININNKAFKTKFIKSSKLIPSPNFNVYAYSNKLDLSNFDKYLKTNKLES